MTHLFRALLAGAAFAGVLASGGIARAEDEYELTVKGGKVVVTAKGDWHVNKDYPWKFTAGDQKLDKSKFTFTETVATLAGAPKGAGKLKGGVCSGEICKSFEKDVTVP